MGMPPVVRGDCECIDGEWGGVCPVCGQRLPSLPQPWSGWRSERIDRVASDNGRMSSTGNLFSRFKRAQAAAARRAVA